MELLKIIMLSSMLLTLCMAGRTVHQTSRSCSPNILHPREREDIRSQQLKPPDCTEMPTPAEYVSLENPLQSSGWHRILSESIDKGLCEWTTDPGECRLTRSSLIGFITQFDGKHEGDLSALESVACDSLGSKMSCEADEACHWDGEACRIFDASAQDAGASCYGLTNTFLRFKDLDAKCSQSFETAAACNEEDGCVWYDGGTACQTDFWNAVIGHPSVPSTGLPKGWTEVTDNVNAQAISNTLKLLTSGGSVDGVLDLDVRNVTCLKSAEPAFCNLVESSFELSKIALYCAVKYQGNMEMCEADDLCDADDDGECQFSLAGSEVSFRDAFEAVVDDPVTAAVFLEISDCADIPSEDSCRPPCMWTNHCVPEPQHLTETLARVSSETSAIGCEFVATVLGSVCSTIKDEGECNVTSTSHGEHCQWFPKNDLGCDVDVEALLDTFLKADPILELEVADAEAKCSEARSRDACLVIEP